MLSSLLERALLSICPAYVHTDEDSRQYQRNCICFSKESVAEVATTVSSFTGGYVAADLVALTCEAAKYISTSLIDMLTASVKVTVEDMQMEKQRCLIQLFARATQKISPSCLRGVTISLPTLTYDDVIGYADAKKKLQRLLRLSSAAMKSKIEMFGIQSLGGALLHGPPGNSKTRLVIAAASSHRLPVISLSSADVYSAYVGDAEAQVRKAFRLARQASPCVLFIDELDAIVNNRADSSSGKIFIFLCRVALYLTTLCYAVL